MSDTIGYDDCVNNLLGDLTLFRLGFFSTWFDLNNLEEEMFLSVKNIFLHYLLAYNNQKV